MFLFPLGVFFANLNYICLSLMQIHTYFYLNYIIYSGLLIFCCQNVANICFSLTKYKFTYKPNQYSYKNYAGKTLY